jgi:hypothetical protein
MYHDLAQSDHLDRARKLSLKKREETRSAYLQQLFVENMHLKYFLKFPLFAKVALVMLYAAEGGKSTKNASVRFGNSDPMLIKLFLKLLRQCYPIDNSKFRCTVQCRADQDPGQLEKFWYNITGIPATQFYKTRIDPRTIGKPSKKLWYKGVCRIDYFSSHIFFDIMKSIEVITGP